MKDSTAGGENTADDPYGTEADLDGAYSEILAETLTRHPGLDETVIAIIEDVIRAALQAGFYIGEDAEYSHPR